MSSYFTTPVASVNDHVNNSKTTLVRITKSATNISWCLGFIRKLCQTQVPSGNAETEAEWSNPWDGPAQLFFKQQGRAWTDR